MNNLNFPKPSPSSEYRQMIDRGFKRYPERLENYLEFKASKKSANISYMPIKIDIENVSRCNLRCTMCLVSTLTNGGRAEDLLLDYFKKIIDEQYGVFEIKVQGVGEPFLQKDYIKMVKYASDKDIWVRSTTNGTLLHKNENYKRIVDANVGELQISIDGTVKSAYESIRINSNFERVVENSKLINGYCEKVGIDKTRMWFTLSKDNLHNLQDIPVFAKDLGFKRATISMDLYGWGDEELAMRNKENNVSCAITQDDIDVLLKKADQIGLNLSFWNISERFSSRNICSWPFERLMISSDKMIVPCCMISDPTKYSFGHYDNFNDIWFGDPYFKFRQMHIEMNLPSVCRSCYE